MMNRFFVSRKDTIMDEAIEIFDNYYNNYDNNQSSVKKKYDHTFRVVDYA